MAGGWLGMGRGLEGPESEVPGDRASLPWWELDPLFTQGDIACPAVTEDAAAAELLGSS